MKPLGAILMMLAFTVSPAGCATSTTTATTWTAPAPSQEWARPGYVEWVREIVHRREGDPVGGAVAGAIIGGLLGGRGAGALVGAAGGAIIGAAASEGSSETRTYQIAVRYDDGGFEVYTYGFTPFRPGELVCQTPRGLMRRR
jgi:outer membrane lipoprotein SlyB